MSDEYVIVNGELMHFGVKGMRWGHRKKYYNQDGSLNKVGRAREAYKQAKYASKEADKDARRANRHAFGISGIQSAKKIQNTANKAYVDMVNAKAEFKSMSAKDKARAEKIADRVYKNAMYKNGIRDSYADMKSGGRSTALYNNVKAKKGKEYADRMERNVQNQAVKVVAASAAVYVGTMVVSAMMSDY